MVQSRATLCTLRAIVWMDAKGFMVDVKGYIVDAKGYEWRIRSLALSRYKQPYRDSERFKSIISLA
eukprot:7379690-Pyramimonas_sp.AAC.2